MRIGIDYSLATATNRGMGRYVREIVRSLMELDRIHTYVLYTHVPITDPLPPHFEQRIIPTSNEIVAEQVYLPRMARADRVDCLWCPANTFPLCLNKKIKLVVTIHDLIFMHKPEGRSSLRQKIGRIYRRWVLRLGKKRIDSCLTVSNFSAAEIQKILGIPAVKVTYNCIDSFYHLAQQVSSPVERAGFYFTVSGDAPSKNLPLLIDTFEEFLPEDCLVIAGLPADSPMRLRATERIVFLPAGISDRELVEKYNLCKAFIFVSLREGFGIPILEALVCGAPIVCSSATSLPEVGGEFVAYVDPTDRQAIGQAIKKVDTAPCNAEQKKKHIEQFLRWSASAQIVLKEFE